MTLILISSLAIWLAFSALHWQPVVLRQERQDLHGERLSAKRLSAERLSAERLSADHIRSRRLRRR